MQVLAVSINGGSDLRGSGTCVCAEMNCLQRLRNVLNRAVNLTRQFSAIFILYCTKNI